MGVCYTLGNALTTGRKRGLLVKQIQHRVWQMPFPSGMRSVFIIVLMEID